MWMVNLMKYRDVAEYADGRESSISGSEADDLYSPLDSLAAVGARPVLFGDVDQQLLGEDTVWDRIGVVKYPTRKSFIDMQALPTFKESHKHKDAGMASTIVMGTRPIAQPESPPGHVPVDWADVPHPPTDDDGPIVVVHVLRFHDAEAAHTTPTHMEQYQTEAAKVSLGHGLRLNGWFAVGRHHHRRWPGVASGAFQRVPKQSRVYGSGHRPEQPRCSEGPPRSCDRRYLHHDRAGTGQHPERFDHYSVAGPITESYKPSISPSVTICHHLVHHGDRSADQIIQDQLTNASKLHRDPTVPWLGPMLRNVAAA